MAEWSLRTVAVMQVVCVLLALVTSDDVTPGATSLEPEDNTFISKPDPEEERLNYLSSNKLQLLQRILQKQKQWELDPAIQRSKFLRESKRGPGGCINKCLTGSGMSFVRCKSMCH